MALCTLPLEVRASILRYVDLKTMFAADAACKQLHEAVKFNAPNSLQHVRAHTMARIQETHGTVVSYDSHTSVIKAFQDFTRHRPRIQRHFKGRRHHLSQFASQYNSNTLEVLDPARDVFTTYERCARIEILALNLISTCGPKTFKWCHAIIREDLRGLLMCCPSLPDAAIRTDFDQLHNHFKASRSFLGVPMSHPPPAAEQARISLTPTHDDYSEYPVEGEHIASEDGGKQWYCTVEELGVALNMPLPSLGSDNFSYCVCSEESYRIARALVKGEKVNWKQLSMVLVELHIY